MNGLWLLMLMALALSGCKESEEEWVDDVATDLEKLPGVVSVSREECADFAAKFKIFFEQPIDHDNPGNGSFRQLVYLCLTNPDNINVLITEGYYAFDAQSTHELTRMFDANQIVVEHRYYGESLVDDKKYMYNDAKSSCDDLHAIVSELKSVLKGKWISTGRSKSGLTCNMYRAYYPNDVDVTVPYGSPFCIGRYDGRMAQALRTSIGTPEGREKLVAFEREVLKRRDVMVQKWDSTAVAQGIDLRLPADQMLDICVMDLPVGFWVYSFDVDEIPDATASDDDIFNYMISLEGPDSWEADNDVTKYYTEAYKELGHYELPTDGVEDLLVVDDSVLKDFLKYIYVPDGVPDAFSTTMHKHVDDFLRKTDAPYLFIYGGWDPWCSVGIGPEYVRGNIHRYVLPEGGHRTTIADFDPATQAEIKNLLLEWMKER